MIGIIFFWHVGREALIVWFRVVVLFLAVIAEANKTRTNAPRFIDTKAAGFSRLWSRRARIMILFNKPLRSTAVYLAQEKFFFLCRMIVLFRWGRTEASVCFTRLRKHISSTCLRVCPWESLIVFSCLIIRIQDDLFGKFYCKSWVFVPFVRGFGIRSLHIFPLFLEIRTTN